MPTYWLGAQLTALELKQHRSSVEPLRKTKKEHNLSTLCIKKMDDFDTSLLIPDVIMEVENDPITTRNESNLPGASDQTSSPFDFNITGCKAQFELTEEEDRLRRKTFTIDNPVQNSKIHCTACNTHLGSALNNLRNVYVHPLLLVIVCNECFDFYSSDCFDQDEDGSEMFCRWCGQGGQVICCSSCPMVFCKLCIRINFGAAKYAEIRDKDEWRCFVCEPNQTIALRVHCFEFAAYVRKEISRLASAENENDAMQTDHTRCCLATVVPNRRRAREDDPDYVPSSATTLDRNLKTALVDDKATTHHEQDEVSESKAETDAVQSRSTPMAQMVVKNDHSYCKPPGQQMSADDPTKENPAKAPNNSWSLSKPPDAKVPRLQPIQSAASSSTGSFQIMLKQRIGPQTQPHQVATPSPAKDQTVPPAPLLILTNFHSNPNVKLGVLKNGQKVILTPLGSIQNNTSKRPAGAGTIQIGQGVPAAEESTQAARENTLKAPTSASAFQFVQQKETEPRAKPAAAVPPQLRRVPSFIVQAKKVPAQSVLERQESVELQAKLRLTEKAIREASLANGTFGSTIMELQRVFASAKYAQDYVSVHNTLQESLSTVLVRLLQANKDIEEGFKDRAGGGITQKSTTSVQNVRPTCCPMGSNNCLRLLKYLGKDSQSPYQKIPTGGNPA